MSKIARRLFDAIPALRGSDRLRAELAIDAEIERIFEEWLEDDGPDDPEPDPGENVIPFRRAA